MQSYIWKKSDKARLANLRKRVENDYVQNKVEYLRTVTASQIILLNYQPDYNSNINSQSNGFSNQLMFAQRGKTGGDEGEGKEKEQRPRRNMDHITWNDYGEKVVILGTVTD